MASSSWYLLVSEGIKLVYQSAAQAPKFIDCIVPELNLQLRTRTMNRFLDQHKDNWRRLEDLLQMTSGAGLRGLSRMEVRELGELYRRAAADLAIARAETRDPK